MNLSHHPTHTPHQSACYSRAVRMGYNPITAAEQALARANSRAFLATLLSVVFLDWKPTG